MPTLALQTHYLAPPPPVTQIHAWSHAYWRAHRWARIAKPIAAPIYKALRYAIVISLFQLRQAAQRLGHTINRAAKAAGNALLKLLRDLLRAMVKPALVLAAVALFWVVGPRLKIEYEGAKPPPAAALPVAHLPPAKPGTPRKKPPAAQEKPAPEAAALSRFHGKAQTFNTPTAAVAALADALNIPTHVVASDLTRALELADTNSSAMQTYVGHFPLPANTSPRLLSVLTPADVLHLARLLNHTTTVDKRQFTLTASLASGDLHLEAKVQALPWDSAARQCFRYAMTFMRRSFRHTLTTTACRTGTAWSFLTPKANRSTP